MSEMGGLESFAGAESSEGIDQAALERLRERMKAAQAQAKRDQKREQKQKKTEGNLAQVIIALLNKGQKGLIKVVTAAVNANIPAFFIVAVLSLRFKTVRKEIGLEINTEHLQEGNKALAADQSLVPANVVSKGDIPIAIKFEMDIWLKFLIEQSQTQPHKLLGVLNHEEAMFALINLHSYIIQDYLQTHQVEFNGQNIVAFSQNYCNSLKSYLEDYTKKQKQLAGEEKTA